MSCSFVGWIGAPIWVLVLQACGIVRKIISKGGKTFQVLGEIKMAKLKNLKLADQRREPAFGLVLFIPGLELNRI